MANESPYVSRIKSLIKNHRDIIKGYDEILKENGVPKKHIDNFTSGVTAILEGIENQRDSFIEKYSALPNRDLVFHEVYSTLNRLLNYIDLFVRNSKVPLVLYYLTDNYFKFFNKQLNYIIIVSDSEFMETIIGIIDEYFQLPAIRSFHDSILNALKANQFAVIALSRKVVNDPMFWPVIFHEASHALEELELNIIKKYYNYPFAYGIDQSDPSKNIPNRRIRWAGEFLSDALPTKIFGPIIPLTFFNYYARYEETCDDYHPYESARIEEMCKILEEDGIDAREIREKCKGLYSNLSHRDEIENIIDRIDELRAEIRIYTRGKEYSKSIKDYDKKVMNLSKELNKWRPKYEDVRILINTLNYIAPENKDDSEFKDFLSDCIRLNLIKEKYETSFTST